MKNIDVLDRQTTIRSLMSMCEFWAIAIREGSVDTDNCIGKLYYTMLLMDIILGNGPYFYRSGLFR